MIFESIVPDHVVGLEVSKLGNRFHAFLLIRDRDTWISEDPEHRSTVFTKDPRVLAAWKAFSIVLHTDPKAQRALWR